MYSIALLTIGDEICIGQVINTNAAWIAEQCTGVGARVEVHAVVGDESERMLGEMDRLTRQYDCVIVTGGLIMIWFNINKSSAMTVSHAEARDIARDGIARLSREIRDVEALAGNEAVQVAEENVIVITTTFNREGNEVETTKPRLVRYRYEADERRLYRDVFADGVTDPDAASPERTNVVIPYMLNDDDSPLFTYTYVNSDSDRVEDAPEVTDAADRARIQLVRIHALVDLEPGKAPQAMDITTQVQLRNQRILL